MFLGMPRVADHAGRRRQVVEATIRVMAARGAEGATVADVASEAGVSSGLVQRYFHTKDAMLLLTFEHLAAGLVERLGRSWAVEGSMRERMRRCLLEFLPLDAERTAEVRVYVAFCGRAVSSEALRRVQAASYAALRASFAEAVMDGQRCGDIAPDRDPFVEGTALWSFIDGLTLQMAADPAGVGAAEASRLVDRQLDHLFLNV